jgi:hypothetical protein
LTLPNFLVVGAMKSGTDSLWQYLRRHPQVFMSDLKEPEFFVTELNWSRGVRWYEQQFVGADGAVAVGEASTSYSKYPLYRDVPSRIADTIPDVRLIYLIRQPIERIRSQYLHQRLLREERRPIERAVLEDSSYVDFSRYAMQIDRYLECFDRSHLLVVRSEDLRSDRDRTLRRIVAFLGLDGVPSMEVVTEEFHRTVDKRVLRDGLDWLHHLPGYERVARRIPRPIKTATYRLRTRGVDTTGSEIDPVLRSRLEALLRDDVVRLPALLGAGFDAWGLI